MVLENKNKNVYVGNRYVPKIFGVWDKLKTYESLSIVTWEGTSYTSKKRVPEGVDILNEEYWVVTGNYNAQVENYRQEVRDMRDEVDLKVDQVEFDDSVNSLNSQLAQTVAPVINVKGYGAIGDGVTDDTQVIQDALNELYERGGGELYFPLGNYLVTSPLLVKSVAETGGYSYPAIRLRGEGNRGSMIIKEGNEKSFNLDATVILIKGDSMDIEEAVSAIQFDNISVTNNSDGVVTYGVYMKRGSRIDVNYSYFSMVKDETPLETHDRYAFYMESAWSCNFKNVTFSGDYGLWINQNSTSIIIENAFCNTDKIGYRLVGNYSTIISAFGDYSQGILFDFHHANYSVVSMGGESRDCHTMVRFTNSRVTINTAFLYQSSLETGTVINLNGSDVDINKLNVNTESDVAKGYLWTATTESKLNIDGLVLSGGSGKFKYNDFDKINTNFLNITISEPTNRLARGLQSLNNLKSGYWDWYMETPEYPLNNVLLGMRSFTENSKGEDLGYAPLSKLNDFYLNADFSNKKVLGWVRHGGTGNQFREGQYHYVPLLLVGGTSARPEKPHEGMEFWDRTLKKPIYWDGSGWLDAMGNDV